MTYSVRCSQDFVPHIKCKRLRIITISLAGFVAVSRLFIGFVKETKELPKLRPIHRQQQFSTFADHSAVPVKGESFDGFCAWRDGGTLQSCTQLLKKPTSSAKHFYFLGDSTIFRLYSALATETDKNYTIVKEQKGVDKWTYLEMPHTEDERFDNWVRPNITKGEGPVTYVGWPWRMDCSSCGNVLIELTNGVQAEWLGVEYTRDVAFPTNVTETTQETIGLYMQQQSEKRGIAKEETVCIANAGLHDFKIANFTTEMHLANVRDYQHILRQHCGVMIWKSISGVVENRRYKQSNAMIQLWNDLVSEQMKEGRNEAVGQSKSLAFFLDVYDKSLKTKHADGTHLDMGLYYVPFVDFFWSLMNSTRGDAM
jgi:hypothetical protein